mmetsp:Transcript_16542/g.24680  ORF Transcript_16542/g.24680 Transcript_16542/m.24680 type:complete len:339 (-) Transcript_16542:123-1139(-)
MNISLTQQTTNLSLCPTTKSSSTTSTQQRSSLTTTWPTQTSQTSSSSSCASSEHRRCTNCSSFIATKNFRAHTRYCQRHLVRCTRCDEMVQRSKLAEHTATHHTPVKCDKCGHALPERSLLVVHKANECVQRDVICFYCKLCVCAKDIADHQEKCSTRTEFCNQCDQYVMLKHLSKHIATQCAFPLNRYTSPPLTPNTTTHCSPKRVSSPSTTTLADFFVDKLQLDDDDKQPHVLLQSIGYQNQQASCLEKTVDIYASQNLVVPDDHPLSQIQKSTVADARLLHMFETYQQEVEETSSTIPCDICGEQIVVGEYMEHQSHCFDSDDDYALSYQDHYYR